MAGGDGPPAASGTTPATPVPEPVTPAPPAGSPGRAGRNLPAAIAVGLGLGAVALVTLYTVKPLFLAVVAVAVTGGVWETTGALRTGGRPVPRPPLLAAAAGVVCAAYVAGPDGLLLAALLAAVAVAAWPARGFAVQRPGDIAAGLLVLGYLPLLAGFAALLLAPGDGPRLVTVFIATTVASDIGGYAVGALIGRHPMAPRISPKKSWEGFAGSTAGCALIGALLVDLLLGRPWWQGVLFGLAVVCSATLGDLAESMLKRDLGIKDMGSLLPGHGGLMERLDSLISTAPVAWLILGAIAGPGH
jgi:phosphatidate cytidylyltransferase